MSLRRFLATAAVAAVTTPVGLLSVNPAFADTKPAAQEQPGKPTLAQLEKAAAEAQSAYDDAVLAEKDGRKVLEAALSDTSPLAVAATAAKKEAADAATAKTAAEKALADARTVLDALPETATEEERAAAEKAVTDAEATVRTADETKTAADARAQTAMTARDDARVAAARQYGLLQNAVEKTLETKTAADEALAKAREEAEDDGDDDNEGDDDCAPADLTTVATGLPSKVVAGEWVTFRLRVTNESAETMDDVHPYAFAHATDTSGLKDTSDLLRLQWSSASSTAWNTVDESGTLSTISPLKAGAHSDIKLRLKADAKAPAGHGAAFVAGYYINDDESCGGTPGAEMYEFDIAAAGSNPGKVPDAEPKPGKTPAPGPTPSATAPAPRPLGAAATQPVNGSLAATGSSAAVPQLALAAAATVAAGAGAVFVVRRRKAGSAA
ncbi:peptidase [Streptomyces agglomeratus]|uniref:peptidase n=1 Tax=Streptomyces agglomeratus TaxID=285458 RepID=UPI0008541DE8|nr:peptidase [Streptomyces agglomeratus]OEJ39415.1 peptidase [Streptomyces agglomeratus]OEJ46201.1 peptidase [Streptomyces agglomeratus]